MQPSVPVFVAFSIAQMPGLEATTSAGSIPGISPFWATRKASRMVVPPPDTNDATRRDMLYRSNLMVNYSAE